MNCEIAKRKMYKKIITKILIPCLLLILCSCGPAITTIYIELEDPVFSLADNSQIFVEDKVIGNTDRMLAVKNKLYIECQISDLKQLDSKQLKIPSSCIDNGVNHYYHIILDKNLNFLNDGDTVKGKIENLPFFDSLYFHNVDLINKELNEHSILR